MTRRAGAVSPGLVSRGMLFNSFEFLVYFPVVVAIYFALPHRWRWLHLLLASYVFYMAWEPAYALLIAASTIVDYFVGLRLPQAEGIRRKALLGVSLTLNLGLLFSFKYYNLINGTFQAMMGLVGLEWPLPESTLLLPVGISFYTFQTLGYTIDVYRGQQAPEPHLGRFALYVSFFPQLVAGPIERASRLLPQFRQDFDWDNTRVISGLRLMAWGMFKKVVVADRLAVLVDTVYADPDPHGGPWMALATVFFGFQLYCDFSGYSDIAIGAARVMGYRLMVNFNQPNLSRSVAEFWAHWHISLLDWFRDYVYIPLGGSRRGKNRTLINIMIVFGVSGLWHGSGWQYLTWGLLNGCYLIFGRLTASARERMAVAIGLTKFPRIRAAWQMFSAVGLVYLSFVFLRATSLQHAVQCIGNFGVNWSELLQVDELYWTLHDMGLDFPMLGLMILLIPLTELGEYIRRHAHEYAVPTWVQWTSDYAMLFAIMALGRFSREPFFYFQF